MSSLSLLVIAVCVLHAFVTVFRALSEARVRLDDRAARASRWAQAGLLVWVGGAIVAGALGTLTRGLDTLPPRLMLGIALPVIAVLGLLAISPSLRRVVAALPLSFLIGAQLFRVVGLALILGHAQGLLPARFAWSAGPGDVITALAAPWVASLVKNGRPGARSIALIWSVFGFLDLVDAGTFGILSAPTPLRVFFDGPSTALMTTQPWVLLPTFLVPLGIVLHVLAFRRLLAGETSAAGSAVRAS